jgi:hypothetical protein
MSSAAPPVLVPPDIQRTTFHTLQKASRAAQQEQHTWWLLYFFLAMFAIAWGTLQLSLRLPERRPTQAPVNWALLAHHPEQLLPTHPAPTSLHACPPRAVPCRAVPPR